MAATTQNLLLAAVPSTSSAGGGTATSELVMLAAFPPPATKHVRATQNVMLAAVDRDGVPNPATSQLVVLAAYRTGSVQNLTQRAWTFTLDGHTMYVITLGDRGTFVYDQSTGEWAKWQTEGHSGWNMEIGTTWQNRVIAADQNDPILWELDPTSFVDDGFKPQTRKVTGGLPVRGRAFPSNYAFSLVASLGEPNVPTAENHSVVPGQDPETVHLVEPTVRLRFSDDQGKTFTDAGTLTIIPGDFVQDLEWRSLGTMRSPGRVFEITDTGAIVRIDGADAETDGDNQ